MYPSEAGEVVNNSEVIQRKLGPLVTRCALKNLSKLSARYGQQRGKSECGVWSADCGI